MLRRHFYKAKHLKIFKIFIFIENAFHTCNCKNAFSAWKAFSLKMKIFRIWNFFFNPNVLIPCHLSKHGSFSFGQVLKPFPINFKYFRLSKNAFQRLKSMFCSKWKFLKKVNFVFESMWFIILFSIERWWLYCSATF